MRNIFLAATLALSTLVLSGCGEKVEVPPASVGMILGANGYEEIGRASCRERVLRLV